MYRSQCSRLRRLRFEPLEDRRLLAVLTVNSLLDNVIPDDGLVTLREAVAAANADTATDLGDVGSGADVIRFSGDLAGLVDVWEVGDTTYGPSALSITSDVTIEGRIGVSTIRRHELSSRMRVFVVHNGGELTLRSLNVRGGRTIGEDGESGLGGAAYVAPGGRLNVISSTLHGNVARGGDGATGRGGALYIDGGEVMLLNATISGNSVHNSTGGVAGFGAAIYCRNGRLAMYNSTIVVGAAEESVPGRCLYVLADGAGAVAELRAYNCIFAGPVGGNDVTAVADAGGQIITAGDFNIVSQGSAGFIKADTTDPLIAPLADNGGPTLTHVLVVVDENHPAVDQGDPDFDLTDPDGDPLTNDAVLFDQRGAPNPRVVDGYGVLGPRVDRGAIEFRPAAAGPELPGDYNGDRTVNAADYTVWRNSLGQSVGRWSGADGDGDEEIGLGDYTIWKLNFGESLPEADGTTLGGAAPAASSSSLQVAAVESAPSPTDLAIDTPSDEPIASPPQSATKDWWPAGLTAVPPSVRTIRLPTTAAWRGIPPRRLEPALTEPVAATDEQMAVGSSHPTTAEESPFFPQGCAVTSSEWDAVWSGLAGGALT